MPTTDRRAERRARRLTIARRRQRIAAQPRVGDVVIGRSSRGDHWEIQVQSVRADGAGEYFLATRIWFNGMGGGLPLNQFTGLPPGRWGMLIDWTEAVRRAQMTEEAA